MPNGSGQVKNKNYKNRIVKIISLLLCLMLSSLFAAGCGKKTPPVPPGRSVAPLALRVTKEIHGRTLTLRWTAGRIDGKEIWRKFSVFRSKTGPGESACSSCPIVFQHVTDIPAAGLNADTASTSELKYQEQLEAGLHYVYKVTGYSENGMNGHDSNLITVDPLSDE